MNIHESALNRIKEITIYETAKGMYNNDKEPCDICGKCNPNDIADYIDDAKEELIVTYPDVNWSTLKYGLDIR
jgi:hypothetical protein